MNDTTTSLDPANIPRGLRFNYAVARGILDRDFLLAPSLGQWLGSRSDPFWANHVAFTLLKQQAAGFDHGKTRKASTAEALLKKPQNAWFRIPTNPNVRRPSTNNGF